MYLLIGTAHVEVDRKIQLSSLLLHVCESIKHTVYAHIRKVFGHDIGRKV